ncbi:hypothetical protein Tco_0159525 [Tanacetum coccineum]
MPIYKVPMGVLNRIESICRRFFNGADNNERKISMIGWQKVLASKKQEGLEFLVSLPLTGRSCSNGFGGAVSRSSLWYNIIRELGNLSIKGINFLSHMKKKVGNGVYTSFWEEPWLSDISLMHAFPRLYALESNKQVTVAAKLSEGSLTDSFR